MTNEEAKKELKALLNMCNPSPLAKELEDALKMAIKALEQQSKTGHWIYTSKRRLVDETDEGSVYITDCKCTCSECGGDFGFQKMSDAYCKYCGAKMVESHESEDV